MFITTEELHYLVIKTKLKDLLQERKLSRHSSDFKITSKEYQDSELFQFKFFMFNGNQLELGELSRSV